MRTKTFVINSRSGALRTASALTSKTSRPVAAAMSTPESMKVRVKAHSLQLEHHAGQRFPVRYRPSLTVGDHWRRSSAGVPTASWPRVSLMEKAALVSRLWGPDRSSASFLDTFPQGFLLAHEFL